MRLRPALAAALILAACDPQSGGEASSGPSARSSEPCPLAMEWQAGGPGGGLGAFVINPQGRMAWSVHGGGEGMASLDGRNLHIRFDALEHEFQVDATLSEDCASGEGTIDVRRYPGEGNTGTFPITLQAGRADAWRDHPGLREGAAG
ncbi:hypothetical protein [Brevundimonas sp.]|uniref:hypothetical protein n=1 Tax=Brevundimonas sp. TaxID=1871086 RepID=UPI0025E02B0F|nr:hypothetical protein [Brevundimonas sp.]